MQARPDNTIPFLKMHGAGNDFVIIDNRSGAYRFSEEEVREVADRHTGVGCDQLVLLEKTDAADVFMRLYNSDGGEVSACGNATRCVGWLLLNELPKEAVLIETGGGLLECAAAGDMRVRVNMKAPKLDWRQIPMAEQVDTMDVPIMEPPVNSGVAVNMGNPHVVFFVDSVEDVPLHEIGPKIEHDPMFPERVNVEVVEVKDAGHLKMRVWERGVGETKACGTGACAVMVAARLRGLADEEATITQPGGDVVIEWAGTRGDAPPPVFMTGEVAIAFKGEWSRG